MAKGSSRARPRKGAREPAAGLAERQGVWEPVRVGVGVGEGVAEADALSEGLGDREGEGAADTLASCAVGDGGAEAEAVLVPVEVRGAVPVTAAEPEGEDSADPLAGALGEARGEREGGALPEGGALAVEEEVAEALEDELSEAALCSTLADAVLVAPALLLASPVGALLRVGATVEAPDEVRVAAAVAVGAAADALLVAVPLPVGAADRVPAAVLAADELPVVMPL